MLSTLLEAFGLALLAAGVTAGVFVLAGIGWALLTFGIVGGSALIFVGFALSVSEGFRVRSGESEVK